MGENAMVLDRIVSMSGQAADRLLKLGDSDTVFVYLNLLHKGSLTPVNWDRDRVQKSIDNLVKLGLVSKADAKVEEKIPIPDEIPQYNREDIQRELSDNGEFIGLQLAMSKKLGYRMNFVDLAALYTLYDYLAMPAEVILILAEYCAEEMEQKYGQGRKPRMPQIKKEGFRWHNLGIETVQGAEEFLKKQRLLSQREKEILPLIGIINRIPLAKERKYLEKWIEQGFENGAIALAYENTVMKKQEMNWAYMDGILKSWHAKNLHTAEAVEQAEKNGKNRYVFKTPVSGAQKAPAPNSIREIPADTARENMERNRRLLERMKQQGND